MAKQISYYNKETGQDYGVALDDIDRQQALESQGFQTDYKRLNSDVLRPIPTSDFQTYAEPDVFNVASLSVPEIQMTQPEQEAQGFNERLRALNEQLLGESSFRTEQEKTQNIAGLTQTQRDLSNRLKLIQAESQSIPLQLQQEATGRGVTAGGLAPLQTARLRTNAIQALGTSALMEAANGNLVTAQSLVDRAVAQKYDPVREQIGVTKANLELVLNSPEYSIEEKKRAQKQLDAQNAKEKQVEKQEADEKTIMAQATEAAKNGADAVTLQKIMDAKTPEEALRIATEAGLFETTEKLDTFVQEISGRYLLINKQTGETIKDMGAISPEWSDPYKLGGDYVQKNTKTGEVKVAVNMPAGGGSGLGGGSAGVVSGVTQAIIDNPSLFDDLTPTNKGKVVAELQANGYDTANLGVKGLSDTAINSIAQTQKALSDLSDLRSIITKNFAYIGPITGLQKYNPWSPARKVQADVDRVKQTVGKALEGGVLRKEDEDKYKKILATLTDTPDTALYKIDSILSSIQRDIENYKNLQSASGKSLDVKESLTKKGEGSSAEDLRSKYNY